MEMMSPASWRSVPWFAEPAPKAALAFRVATRPAFNSNNCSDCTISDRERSIDGNRETFATVGLPMLAVGSAALRAQAQQGLVFPAGQVAAAVISEGPDFSRLHIRTYLMNVLQEENAPSATTQDQVTIVGFKTTKQFDQVELLIDGRAGAGQSAAAESVRVREFCSNGVVSPF